jgi:hypothetical protein
METEQIATRNLGWYFRLENDVKRFLVENIKDDCNRFLINLLDGKVAKSDFSNMVSEIAIAYRVLESAENDMRTILGIIRCNDNSRDYILDQYSKHYHNLEKLLDFIIEKVD